MDPNEQARDEILKNMSGPDAILDAHLLPMLINYLKLKGQPSPVVHLLSESYRGYAQMCNLLMDWLKATGLPEPEVHAIVESHLKSYILLHFNKETVDAKLAASTTAPVWLDSMIAHPTWRSLIYQLSEKNQSSLLLNYAIKKISDAGHQDEMASVTTASTDAVVFSRVLVYAIYSFSKQDEDTAKKSLSEFVKNVCHSQHTFLYAQCLLHSLGMKRLFEEVQLCARRERNESVARNVGLILYGGAFYPSVLASVSSILSSKSASPADVSMLAKIYCPPALDQPVPSPSAALLGAPSSSSSSSLSASAPPSSQPPPSSPPPGANPLPPIDLLQDPEFIDILVSALFDPRKQVNAQYKSKYIAVLAFAASVYDEQLLDSAEPAEARNTAEYPATYKALEAAQDIVQKQSSSASGDLHADMAALCPHLTFPVVSMGVLYWIKSLLLGTGILSSTFNTSTVPWHLAVVDEIAFLHTKHRREVFDLLSKLFLAEFDLDPLVVLDLKRIILDRMIFLLSLGHALPVVYFVRDCLSANKVDMSLIRHFVHEVVDFVQPPFSLPFLNALLDMALDPYVLDMSRKAEYNAPIIAFLKTCITLDVFHSLNPGIQSQIKDKCDQFG